MVQSHHVKVCAAWPAAGGVRAAMIHAVSWKPCVDESAKSLKPAMARAAALATNTTNTRVQQPQ
jgi:hypothetical protein